MPISSDAGAIPGRVDVVIVGAGPAGLTAAAALRRAGADVLLLDARRKIGTPLRCGELTRKQLFEYWEMEPRPGWVRWEYPEGVKGIVIDREKIEFERSRELADAGVRVFEGVSATAVGDYDGSGRAVTVRVGDAEARVHTPCVFAADGVASRVAQWCGIPTFLHLTSMGTCLAYRLKGATLWDTKRYALAYFQERFPFYFWVIPSGEDEASVGIVLPGYLGFRLRGALAARLAAAKIVKGGSVVQTVVGTYPIAPPIDVPYADGLLVLGTAARLINPNSGEGILPAARSGVEAAATLLAARDTTAANLKSYRDRLADTYDGLHAKWRDGKPYDDTIDRTG